MTLFIPIALILSYVLGSIPSGLWLGLRFRGIDIRKEGSKNIGATNTMRTLGKLYGLIALSFDIFKGWLPVVLAPYVHSWEYLPLACGIAAILGHTFSIFVWFRGGKGVATSTGVFLGLAPLPTAIAAAVFFAVVAATRMVSAGSVAAAATLGVAVFFVDIPWSIRWVTLAVAALVILKHHSNIRRILRHEENKL
ncbi:MAG: glycerol-3-phosphate 1-O-acyltransferase PlsY [Candidatus Hydrogenedentes bacterium]|nr:glycerol-3-phosphate 1-O-acyltransferase PlsY [Candidatus Hydrogenedentota bacterium]